MPISPTWENTIDESPSWDTTSEHVEEGPSWDDTSEHIAPIGQLPGSQFGAGIQAPNDLTTQTITGQADIPGQETALSANMKDEAFRPGVTLPGLEIHPDDSRTLAIGKQAVNVLKSIPEFFTSPAGAASIPAAILFPTLTTGAFTADMLHSLGAQIHDAYKNWDAMTPAQQGVALANMMGTGAFAGLGAKGTFKGVEAKAMDYIPRGAGVGSVPLLTPIVQPNQKDQSGNALLNQVPRGTGIGGLEPVETPSTESPRPETPLDIVEPPKLNTPEAPVAPTDFLPALKTKSGKIIAGESGKVHNDIYASQPGAEGAMLRVEQPEHGFIKDGKFYSREEAAAALGEKEPLQSERLIELQETPKPRKSLAQKVAELPPDEGKPEPLMPQEYSAEDLTKFKEFTAQENQILAGGDETTTTDEFKANRKQIEELKNKYGGNRPVEPEIIGLGGAAVGELPESGLGKEIYGIAQRVREERARAGQVIDVEPGVGTNAPDSVAHGRELLKTDPAIAEKSLSTFEADPQKSISADGVAAVRAKGEELALKARRAEEKFGTDSDEFHNSWMELSAWDMRTKPMQTEWSKIGQAQQGSTDIDTGSFTGLQRAYKESSGKEFTEPQTKKAKDLSKKVSKSAKDADKANTDLKKALDSELNAEKERANAEQKQIADIAKAAKYAADKAAEAKARFDRSTREYSDALKAEIAARRERTPAENRALDAASKTVREAAARAAKAEAAERVRITKLENQGSRARWKAAEKAAQKAAAAASKTVREAAIRRSKLEQKYANDPKLQVWEQTKKYLDEGLDNFHEIRTKVATDLGIPASRVARLLAQKGRLKTLADDLYVKQQTYRRFDETARRWLQSTQTPLLNQVLASIPRTMFALKVGFHGTVALGTHAPALAFQPRFWKAYVENFGKMYKLVGSRAYYETQIQDLIRRPNYVRARRAGLVNDPFTYEDFNNPELSKYFGGITGMGNRGYSVLKILRQDVFDQHWNTMPKGLRSPEMAELLADSINHVTGVTKGMSPKGANVALFAPRLLASRAMWLAGDPVKAAGVVARWKNASREEKYFAREQIKEKLWVAGTFFSLLALNQGLLNATGSRQKINGIPESLGGKGFDPMKADFLKFKAAGMQASYGNAMITAARLPIRIYATASGPGGKFRHLVYPDEDTAKILFEFARSQASPFAGTVADLVLRADFQNRPLPHSERPMPKRLRERGVVPYTWTEYITQQAAPIPLQEGLKEVWGQGFGLSDEQISHYLKSMAIISLMSGTGGRLTEDWDVARPIQP